jgi:hypothetical protein
MIIIDSVISKPYTTTGLNIIKSDGSEINVRRTKQTKAWRSETGRGTQEGHDTETQRLRDIEADTTHDRQTL